MTNLYKSNVYNVESNSRPRIWLSANRYSSSHHKNKNTQHLMISPKANLWQPISDNSKNKIHPMTLR